MGPAIRRTWAVRMAKSQSTWCKPNSPWSNLPKGWSRPDTVYSTSGRKYGWLCSWRRSIGPWSGGRTSWSRLEKDHSTGRLRLKIVWRHSRRGHISILVIMLNGLGSSRLRCFWRNMQAKIWWGGKIDRKETRDLRWIWASKQAKQWEVTSSDCQIQCSRIWLTPCRMATIWFLTPNNSKLFIQM